MASNNDMKAAEGTYNGFLVLLKWGTIISFIIALLVMMMIA